MIIAEYGVSPWIVYGLTRYDYGQILEIRGLEVQDGTEVHFCQMNRAITQYMQSNQVLIPDHLLQYPEDIYTYLYRKDSGSFLKKLFHLIILLILVSILLLELHQD